MIVVDTNVISEVMRPSPSRVVQDWMTTRSRERRCATAVTLAEIRYGIERLPAGRRRALLEAAAEEIFVTFEARILAFDAAAAVHYASIASAREATGRPVEPFDAQIAAICRAHGAALATRNVKDFAGLGVDLIDPWSEAGSRTP